MKEEPNATNKLRKQPNARSLKKRATARKNRRHGRSARRRIAACPSTIPAAVAMGTGSLRNKTVHRRAPAPMVSAS